MDNQTTNQQSQPISDDQELAKALASVSADTSMNFEETGAPVAPEAPVDTVPVVQPDIPEAPAIPEVPTIPLPSPAAPVAPVGDDSLEGIKQTALNELRPLVDKLNVAPEEKFDTYLLLLRSTDDKALIAPAHEAAVAIPDETRKAQALLDIIKEIDYLSAPKQ